MQADAAASSEQLTGAAVSSVQLATSCDRRARVVVCSGVDCMGLGGGAALLEIEELCAEVSSSSGGAEHVEAVSGVCTLQCANAPNVNVHALASDGRSLDVSNHLRVDSAARCAEVLAVATSPPGVRSEVLEGGGGGGIMMRRAAGLRWNALRQLARCHNTYSLHGFDGATSSRASTATRAEREARTAARELLAAALRAEASAARNSEPALARARRRAERLTARAEALERGAGAIVVTPSSK